ncbi:MAG: hypothetical protein PHV34_02600 [Verrucomicrobiae bacterium]|nr:hypothetical protein [Verrucomicrobiae bacterium]
MKLSPEKQKKWMLTALVMGVAIAVVWYLGNQFVVVSKEKNTKELEKTRADVQKRTSDILKEKDAREQAKVYQQYTADWEEKMPKGNPETWMLREISDLATIEKINLANTAMQPLNELSDFKFKDQPYQLIGFRFDFLAELNQIGKFISTLENNQQLMEVDEISISAGSTKEKHVHTVNVRISEVAKQ